MSRPTKCDECENEFDATDRAFQAANGEGELFCSEHCAGRFDGLKGPHTNVPLEELPPRHWPAEQPHVIDEAEETGFEVLS